MFAIIKISMGGKRSGKNRKKLKRLSRLKTWQLILILIPLLFIAATLLRFDHIKMTELKAEVLAADEEGDTEKISSTLEALKEFTFSHIVINVVESNGSSYITFGTGPFYLENQYLRKTAEILAGAEANATDDSNPNGNVFAAAMAVCKPQAIANGWVWNSPGYINCMTSEINNHPTTDTIEETFTVELPSTSLYRYDFSSPVWAPTASGFVILLCLLLIIIIIIRLIIGIFLRIAILFIK